MNGHDQKIKIQHQINYICGIDEAGRGPIAGPVVAAAVIINYHPELALVNDSKKLSKTNRDKLAKIIKKHAISIGIGAASVEEIDSLNIYQATILAMERAVKELTVNPDLLLIDFMKIKSPIKQIAITKGDQISFSIACASIIAKTERDKIMEEYHFLYPNYGLNKHMGYPTKSHLTHLQQFGITPIHRKTFKPVKKILEKA